MKDIAELEIQRRTDNATKLADRFRDFKGLEFRDFLMACDEAGFFADFITMSELHEAINSPESSREPTTKQEQK